MCKIYFFKNINRKKRKKKDLCKIKISGQHLSFNIIGRPQLEHTLKTKHIAFQIVDIFFIKRSGTSFSTTFCVQFFKKNISHVIFY